MVILCGREKVIQEDSRCSAGKGPLKTESEDGNGESFELMPDRSVVVSISLMLGILS